MRELTDDECRAIAGKACLGCDLIRAGYAAGYAAAQSGQPDHQTGGQGHAAIDRCSLGASPLESGNAREATCLSGEHDGRRGTPTQQGQLGANAGSTPAPPSDHQSASTPLRQACDAQVGAAQAVTDGPAADPLPVAWATPSLLVTMSAVEKRRLTSPEMRGRGGEWEADVRDADRYSVPLYRADALERLRAERDEWKRKCGDANVWALQNAARWKDIAERAEAERDALREVVRAADAMRHADQVSIDGTSRSGAPWSVYRRLAIAYDAARAKVKP